jgi:uncharacterized protein
VRVNEIKKTSSSGLGSQKEPTKMSDQKKSSISRRSFVRRTGAATGGLLLGTGALSSRAEAAKPDVGDWPKAVLGRTGVEVTRMTLGTAPCGLCPKIHPPQIAEIVKCALDQGITSIDTAPAYNQSEEGVGMALGKNPKYVFLATKVKADTLDEAEESLSTSLKLLKTDCVDLLYYHNIGDRDVKAAMDPDGVFSWLVKQKKAGKARFLGISGHNHPGVFAQLIETGEVDVLLTIVNFADRHTYGFEEKVLPLAVKHNLGIVAMKVFGGASKADGSYSNPKARPEMDLDKLELAVRYALSTPGVQTVNLGVHNKKQVRENSRLVKGFQKLSADEYAQAVAMGEDIAKKWGKHFGPVA